MPFPTTGSVISTDLDNMLRGLFRDNSDHAVTGTVAETTLASTSVSANTIGPTGGLHLLAVGSAVGAGGSKTVKLYLGATVLMSFTVPASNQCWFVKAWIYNTASTAQRIYVEAGSWAAAVGATNVPSLTYEYETAALDTGQNQTAKVTTTNVSAADTLTQSMWLGYVIQIN